LEKFKSFITEQKDIEKYRVLVISTEHGSKAKTAERLEDEAKKLGIEFYTVKMNGTYIKYDNNKYTIHKDDDEKGFELDRDNTVCFMRGTPERDSYLDLLSQLERIGIPMVNSRICLERAVDKYRTYLRIKDFGLEQPKTVLCPSPELIEKSFENLDTKFPIILKTLRGSKGVGVLFVETERSLNSLIQTLYKMDSQTDLLMQEYIKTDFDVRAIVLDGKVIAAMRRNVVEGDFRSNASQGAEVETIKLTKLEEDQCIHAAKSIGGIFTGVDFIPSKNRETQNPIFLEVNSSPGTENIEDATGINISKILLKHFMDKEKRYTVPTECGFLETVTIDPYGPIIAKFDTGNSSLSVLHAEDIKVVGKKVSWKLFGKTITKPIVQTLKVNLGGLRDYSETRHTVRLDVEFAGTLYKGVEFTLDDRRNRTRILFNRGIMKTFNVIVSPQRKYMVTTKAEMEEGE
jgi:ribosomal protein S6--L-glutamate ligase